MKIKFKERRDFLITNANDRNIKRRKFKRWFYFLFFFRVYLCRNIKVEGHFYQVCIYTYIYLLIDKNLRIDFY